MLTSIPDLSLHLCLVREEGDLVGKLNADGHRKALVGAAHVAKEEVGLAYSSVSSEND